MLIRVPPKYRRKPLKPRVRPPSQAGPPVLVAAEFDVEFTGLVRLTFDRAIDISAIAGGQILVDDPVTTTTLYNCSASATLVSPEIVQMEVVAQEVSSGSVVSLTASPSNGIKSAGDGSAWAGVIDLELPFP